MNERSVVSRGNYNWWHLFQVVSHRASLLNLFPHLQNKDYLFPFSGYCREVFEIKMEWVKVGAGKKEERLFSVLLLVALIVGSTRHFPLLKLHVLPFLVDSATPACTTWRNHCPLFPNQVLALCNILYITWFCYSTNVPVLEHCVKCWGCKWFLIQHSFNKDCI